MPSKSTKFITALLSTGALIFSAHTTLAQQNPAPAPQQQAPQMEVDDATVNNFVGAYTDVQKIHNEYAQRLQNVEDAEEATGLQQEAQNKMQEAVTDNNITVEEYQTIAQQIGQDAELRSRIQERLEAESGS